MRALELCKLIRSQQSLNLALKYTLKVGNSSLAEKITKIIENECDADDKLSELEIPYPKLSNNPSTSYK